MTVLCFALSERTQAVVYQFSSTFGQECVPCPAAGSPGAGTADFLLDSTTGIASYNIAYGGMAGVETIAHVHGPATLIPCQNAGVVYPLPAGQPKIGNSPALTAAQMADMIAGRHYVNIHTSVCGGGEIRAQIVEIPQACCLPGGGCTMLLVDPCRAQGGTPQGPNTTCSPAFEACCVPGGPCLMVDPICCDDLGGVSMGPGSVCLGDGNGNMIDDACEYHNWVIADDFMIMPQPCQNCDCDLNGDGFCTTLDLSILLGCFGTPTPPGCANADLDCDGDVDINDRMIWECLFNGNPPAACCPAAGATPSVTDVKWCGSWLDPSFDPKLTTTPRRVDAWLVALHRDIPPLPCPTGSNYDACGVISAPDPVGCQTFLPDGSATPITLDPTGTCCPGGLPGIFPVGYWRICGFYNTTCTTPCSSGPGALCVYQILPCDTGISRPADLIAQWVFDEPDVPWNNAGKIGCDQHNIFCWGPVPLSRGCLVHLCAGTDEIDPLNPGVFHPRPNETYWISFQASLGHKLVRTPQPCCLPGGGCQMLLHADCLAQGGIPQAGPACVGTLCSPPGPPAPPLPCTEIATGQSAARDFWGWHTTPPGYHQKDDAYMGMLAMGCRMEWIYHWMNHLHWSQPPYYPCADDPTKSIDMAFCLFDFSQGPGQTIWYQPTNPGPPALTPPWFIPQLGTGGIDELPNTVAQAQIEIFGFGTGNVVAQGPTRIWRSFPLSGPTNYIETEIISMQLTGISPFGPAMLNERPDAQSLGQTIMPPVPPAALDSFFDVFVEILLPGAPPGLQNLITQVPVHVAAVGGIWEVPPSQADYQGPAGGPVMLFDRSNPGQPIGRLLFVSHRVQYRGGVDIHSDVDWQSAPMECTCKGDMNADSLLNGGDIQLFVNCLLAPPIPLGCPCDCADMDDNGLLNLLDVGPFVNQMLQNPKAVCPPILCP